MATTSLRELFHVIGTQFTALDPQVCVAVPIFVLRCSELRPKQARASFAVLVDMDTVFQNPPTSVDHLSARFTNKIFLLFGRVCFTMETYLGCIQEYFPFFFTRLRQWTTRPSIMNNSWV